MRHMHRPPAAPLLTLLLILLALFLAGTARGQAPSGYAGSEACADCHKQTYAQFAATRKGTLFLQHPRDDHQRLGCEACHGPGAQHARSGGEERGALISFGRGSPNSLRERNAVCLNCHEKTARILWTGSAHEARDVACTDCHTLMTSVSEHGQLRKATVLETCARCHPQRRAQQLRFTHMPLREGKLECTSCHNPHGSAGEKLLVANTVNETCYTCHPEKRGPFLWEHAPAEESCSNCHDPHGSNHEKMLRVAKPRLCQQCHDETRHPTGPQSVAATRFVMGRQCTNCHFNIHGSNHPSGFAFTR